MDSIADDAAGPDFESIPWGWLGRNLTLGCVSLWSKFVLNVLNTTTIKNGEIYTELVRQRENGRGLITVSNHTSTIDDPVLHCAILPAWHYFTEHRHQSTRYVLCAEELCFRNEFLRQFFMTGKVMPIKRGGGVDQPAMLKMADLVQRGHWLHHFPEGRIGYSGKLEPLKWGIGKLICDSLKEDGTPPVVLPFYHSGLGDVAPRKARLPRIGKTVTITVGMPMDLSHLTCKCGDNDLAHQVWRQITSEIEMALRLLEEKNPHNTNQRRNNTQQEKEGA